MIEYRQYLYSLIIAKRKGNVYTFISIIENFKIKLTFPQRKARKDK